jgi:AraC family L-rhamnose operon transcriptional activator RhaR
MSGDHVARLLTATTRESPRRHLLALRRRAAAEELLRAAAPPVKGVAERCGYSSVHAFSRAFKRVFGTGPATYRRLQTRF